LPNGGTDVTPDQLREAAAKRGFKVSDRTIRFYAKRGIIPTPARKSLGRGQGVTAEYPREALAELLAASVLLGANMLTMAQWTPMTRSKGEHDMTDFLRRRVTLDDIAEARQRFYSLKGDLAGLISELAPTAEQAWKDEVLLAWAELRAEELEAMDRAGH